jgi:hypothetical protein
MRRVLAVRATLAGVVSAAQFDMAAVAKWQAASVVHYRVAGTFRGTTPLAQGTPGGTRSWTSPIG